jgi:microcin C transport system substrate-binding protein
MRTASRLFLCLGIVFCAGAAQAAPRHAIAMHGEPKYAPGFKNFDYVNPDAPKGGELRLSENDTFDNLNPFILKGIAASGLARTYDTLMVKSSDEAFTEYGLVAESVDTPTDRSWVTFNLRPEARFHDGKPITVEDVIFTFETLRAKGHPFYRFYYSAVGDVKKTGDRSVKFTFKPGDNRELPLILGELPVLPRHYWQGRQFDQTTLEPPLGSGPYKVTKVEAGRSIVYERVPDYWAKNLPAVRGFYNFDRIRVDYYRDATVALEAFKAGEYDFRQENTAKVWATGYDFPASREGKVTRVEIPHQNSTGMQGFAYNLRRPLFADRRVREALSYAFNFELANKQLFYGAYTRTRSYFSNTELASSGLPAGEELKILEKYKGRIPEEVFTKPFEPPLFQADEKEKDPYAGALRENLRKGRALLESAGWKVDGSGKLRNDKGELFSFEILLNNPAFERISLPFVKNLERLGIEAKVRTVDATQYQNRMDRFDYDMAVEVFGQSLSPGNEQRDFWGSASADTQGGRNLIGIKDPVVDELVNLVISAPDRQSLVQRTRALDRVLLWGHYVIPHWHLRAYRVAYWNKFGRPAVNPPYDLPLDAWWSKK